LLELSEHKVVFQSKDGDIGKDSSVTLKKMGYGDETKGIALEALMLAVFRHRVLSSWYRLYCCLAAKCSYGEWSYQSAVVMH
jgi:hypothetical protein